MKEKTIKVEGFGKVYLEPTNGIYNVTDEQGNYMGEIDPSENEEWDDNDDYVIAAIIEEMIDNGDLETPSDNEDSYEDF